MTYRMKRNGAGLASICILCTMVLVMISSTLSLYVGMDDSIRTRYPREIYISLHARDLGELSDEKLSGMRKQVGDIVTKHGGSIGNVLDYRYMSTTGVYYDGRINTTPTPKENRLVGSGDAMYVYTNVIPVEDYRRLSGDDVELSDGEVLLGGEFEYSGETLCFDGEELEVVGRAKKFEDNGLVSVMAVDAVYIVTPEFDRLSDAAISMEHAENPGATPDLYWYFGFDPDGGDIPAITLEMSTIEGEYYSMGIENRLENQEYFYSTYGGLFFIGIILSITFMTAAVLIIYYKQMSEGYEDRSRFEIMQKLGMTAHDIRKSVDSQMLTVFSAPMILAGLHIGFAFPFIWRMLKLFALDNMELVLMVTVGVYLVFAAFYAVIYKVTSNEYCKIVSG